MRWDAQRVDVEEPTTLPGMPSVRGRLRTVQVPEFPGLTFDEVRSTSALNHVPGESAMPFPWTINPYRGLLGFGRTVAAVEHVRMTAADTSPAWCAGTPTSGSTSTSVQVEGMATSIDSAGSPPSGGLPVSTATGPACSGAPEAGEQLALL